MALGVVACGGFGRFLSVDERAIGRVDSGVRKVGVNPASAERNIYIFFNFVSKKNIFHLFIYFIPSSSNPFINDTLAIILISNKTLTLLNIVKIYI